MRAGRWIGSAGLAWMLLACGGLPFGRGIVLQHDLDGAAALAAAALADDVVGGALPDEIAKDCEAHAARFTWLAARHDDPLVIAAACRALAGCADQAFQPDLLAVAEGRLDAEEPVVLDGAITLAASVIRDLPPDAKVVSRLVGIATTHPNPAARLEALEALDRRAWTAEPEVSAAFLEALQDDEAPYLVSETLRMLRFRAAGLEQKDAFRGAALVLTSDIDPGIRGRAALLLARLAPDDEDTRAMVSGLLDDKHAYTRSAAAEALADMAYPPAVHALVQHLDDPAKCVWDMRPYTRLDGTEVVTHHTGSHFERVDDAVLRALVRLTEPMGDDGFRYRDVNLRYRDLDIVAATRDARRWYDEHAEDLPAR